jgi:hypothetical protein
MAKEEDDKKPEGGQNEMMQAMEGRDPDEAVFAEQAILHYAHWILEQVQPQIEDALSNAEAWFESQPNAQDFNNLGLIEAEGKVFIEQMAQLFGGHKSPTFTHIFPQLDGAVDQAARFGDISSFMQQVRYAARDACWYLRDNTQSVLSQQWDALRDLAYEGSTEFIPVLHQLGFPKDTIDGTKFTEAFVKEGEAFKKKMPEKQAEAEEKNEGKKEQDAKKDQAAEDKGQEDKLKEQFTEEEAAKKAV